MTLPLRLCVRRTAVAEGTAPTVRVSLRLPSDVDCIEQAVSLVTHHCLAGVQASPRIRFRLQVALSEALANAIIRGNAEDHSKSVLIQVELQPELIRIDVTDEGRGFDPASVPEPDCPEHLDDTSGRGLFLIRRLVDAVQFNEQGNSICMTLRRL
jgi:serine/threonine-protein kinase RsbW